MTARAKPFRLTAPPGPLEHDIQATFVRMCRSAEQVACPLLRLGFAVPNGGYQLSVQAAGKLRAAGLRPGVPDWLLPVPCGGFSGLAIEFKRPGGVLSDAQAQYIDAMVAAGWLAVVVTDAGAAFRVAIGYLESGVVLPVGRSPELCDGPGMTVKNRKIPTR